MFFIVTIRQELPADYEEVYALVQASFKTSSHSDGTEADYLNAVRTSKNFIPELSFVAEAVDGKIVGQIVLYQTCIATKDGSIETLVLSPLSVHPACFRQGIARQLVDYALTQAASMGYTAVFLCGDPAIYQRLGFCPSYEMQIFHKLDPKARWCMGRTLVADALQNISGEIDIV